MRQKGRTKPASAVSGLSISKSKKGALTVRRAKGRAFAYVTFPEIAALSKATGYAQSDLWNMFKQKGYIVTKDRMEAERIYADVQSLPF